MGWVKTQALCVLGVLTLVATAPAQSEGEVTLSVSPGPTLHEGEDATITYSDPSADAGDLVIVVIDDGWMQFDIVVIELDENGEGSATWRVPTGWGAAIFTAPNAQMVTRVIMGVGGPIVD